MPKIRCFLCEEPVPVKKTRKGKPYIVCDRCGLQTFVRYGKGIKALRKKVYNQCDDNCLFCDECDEIFGDE
jgi:hypothetical protein